MSGDEAGAGCPGCFAPDTASDDKTLGLVVVDASLPMPPAKIRHWGRYARMLCSGYRQWAYCIKRIFTGAGVCGCFAPDTASNIGIYRIIIGADVPGCLAPETANNYRDK